jgi:hypothetical protein
MKVKKVSVAQISHVLLRDIVVIFTLGVQYFNEVIL